MSFRDRYGAWALVAGASDGIGEAFARRIAERGVNVLLLARREEMLERLAGADPRGARRRGAPARGRSHRARPRCARRGCDARARGGPARVQRRRRARRRQLPRAAARPCAEAGRVELPRPGAARAPPRRRDARARKRGGIVLVTSMVALSGSAHVAAYAASKVLRLDPRAVALARAPAARRGCDGRRGGHDAHAEPARVAPELPRRRAGDGAGGGGARRPRLPRPRPGLVRRQGQPRRREGPRRHAAARADRHDESPHREPYGIPHVEAHGEE